MYENPFSRSYSKQEVLPVNSQANNSRRGYVQRKKGRENLHPLERLRPKAGKKGSSGRKRLAAAAIFAALFFINLFFQPLVHWEPFWSSGKEAAQKQDLASILQKKSKTREDWEQIFFQTGLGRGAAEELEAEEILQFQDFFMESRSLECRKGSCFTRQDRAVLENGEAVPLVPLEDGDLFLSFSSHTLGWKHGHAGLVADAEAGMCLEAVMPGYGSTIKSLHHWQNGAGFILLRLKGASREERAEIAAFARNKLRGVPYSLLSGIFDGREEEDVRKMTAQCAYLIWYAFMQFGYDLDGDGGRLVTVEDLLKSPDLEVIQIFGTDPKWVLKKRQQTVGQEGEAVRVFGGIKRGLGEVEHF